MVWRHKLVIGESCLRAEMMKGPVLHSRALAGTSTERRFMRRNYLLYLISIIDVRILNWPFEIRCKNFVNRKKRTDYMILT